MSLRFEQGTNPYPIEAKTYGIRTNEYKDWRTYIFLDGENKSIECHFEEFADFILYNFNKRDKIGYELIKILKTAVLLSGFGSSITNEKRIDLTWENLNGSIEKQLLETRVMFKEIDFSLSDFIVLIMYWMTNTNLYRKDPRRRVLRELGIRPKVQ